MPLWILLSQVLAIHAISPVQNILSPGICMTCSIFFQVAFTVRCSDYHILNWNISNSIPWYPSLTPYPLPYHLTPHLFITILGTAYFAYCPCPQECGPWKQVIFSALFLGPKTVPGIEFALKYFNCCLTVFTLRHFSYKYSIIFPFKWFTFSLALGVSTHTRVCFLKISIQQ